MISIYPSLPCPLVGQHFLSGCFPSTWTTWCIITYLPSSVLHIKLNNLRFKTQQKTKTEKAQVINAFQFDWHVGYLLYLLCFIFLHRERPGKILLSNVKIHFYLLLWIQRQVRIILFTKLFPIVLSLHVILYPLVCTASSVVYYDGIFIQSYFS